MIATSPDFKRFSENLRLEKFHGLKILSPGMTRAIPTSWRPPGRLESLSSIWTAAFYSLLLLIQPSFVLAQDLEGQTPDPRELYDLSPKQQEIVRRSFEIAKDFLDNTVPLQQQQFGATNWRKRMLAGTATHEFVVTLPNGVGTIEPKVVKSDDERKHIFFERIIFSDIEGADASGLNVLVFDSPKAFEAIRYKHFKLYYARTLIESNDGKGRTTLVLFKSGEKFSYIFEQVPKKRTPRFRKLFWDTVKVKPTKGDKILTVISVLISGGSVALMDNWPFMLDFMSKGADSVANMEFQWKALSLTVAYSSFFGYYGGTYNNLTTPKNLHDPVARFKALTLRMFISSVSFAVLLQGLMFGWDTLGETGVWIWLMGNSIANNAIKDNIKVFSDIRDAMGLSRKDRYVGIKFTAFGKKREWGATIKQSRMERQLVGYQIGNTLKMADLMGLAFMVNMGNLDRLPINILPDEPIKLFDLNFLLNGIITNVGDTSVYLNLNVFNEIDLGLLGDEPVAVKTGKLLFYAGFWYFRYINAVYASKINYKHQDKVWKSWESITPSGIARSLGKVLSNPGKIWNRLRTALVSLVPAKKGCKVIAEGAKEPLFEPTIEPIPFRL
jgi:hypothetical protein